MKIFTDWIRQNRNKNKKCVGVIEKTKQSLKKKIDANVMW